MCKMSKDEFDKLRLNSGFSCSDVGVLVFNYTGTPCDGDKLSETFQTSHFLSKKDSGLVRAAFSILELNKKLSQIAKAVNLSSIFAIIALL